MFCSQFFDDVSFGHIPHAWEDDVERFPNVLNFTLYHVIFTECLSVLLYSLSGGYSSLATFENFGQLMFVMSAAEFIWVFVSLLYLNQSSSIARHARPRWQECGRGEETSLSAWFTETGPSIQSAQMLIHYSIELLLLQIAAFTIVMYHWSLSMRLTLMCDRWRKISVQDRGKRRRKKRKLKSFFSVQCYIRVLKAVWVRCC